MPGNTWAVVCFNRLSWVSAARKTRFVGSLLRAAERRSDLTRPEMLVTVHLETALLLNLPLRVDQLGPVAAHARGVFQDPRLDLAKALRTIEAKCITSRPLVYVRE